MARIHVLTRKEELDGQRLPGKVVLVVDVLFATSSIAAALANGATEVVPMPDGDAARAEAARRPAGSYVLAGEKDAETLPGFNHPLPLSLSAEAVGGRALILSTTNGSVAIHRSADAARVYAAALVNGEAVIRHVDGALRDETVLVVCAGSGGAFNLEDFYGAGHLVSLLARGNGRHELSDAALAARALHDRSDALECLAASRIGRRMRDRGLEREVAFAAQKGCFDVVPLLADGRMRAV
ncbi:MAG TPA: 2-phosphosulfolactate phosphatase [Anaeromyxobacter sp.]|nr:2-phosphosulfolactate phosphatase [Anaeromyxobacter sp.]